MIAAIADDTCSFLPQLHIRVDDMADCWTLWIGMVDCRAAIIATSWSCVAIKQGRSTSGRCRPRSCKAGAVRSWVHFHLWTSCTAANQILQVWACTKCRFWNQLDSSLPTMCSAMIDQRTWVVAILCRKVSWFIDVIGRRPVSREFNFANMNLSHRKGFTMFAATAAASGHLNVTRLFK